MKTLVLCNQKGGVGKSAVSTLLTHYLAHKGRRVLAIDLGFRQGPFNLYPCCSPACPSAGRTGRNASIESALRPSPTSWL